MQLFSSIFLSGGRLGRAESKDPAMDCDRCDVSAFSINRREVRQYFTVRDEKSFLSFELPHAVAESFHCVRLSPHSGQDDNILKVAQTADSSRVVATRRKARTEIRALVAESLGR